jgi:hypothetical protein
VPTDVLKALGTFPQATGLCATLCTSIKLRAKAQTFARWACRVEGRTWRGFSILGLTIGLVLSSWDCRRGRSTAGRGGPNPGFVRSGLISTAHPEGNPIVFQQVERRLAVTMVQSHRTPSNDHFVHAFVRNVGSATINSYSLWLTVINP